MPGMIRYVGNVTASEDLQPGRWFGNDLSGRPQIVLDAEFREDTNRTLVHFRPATDAEVLARLAELQGTMTQ